ncbi:MAG: hypothetical protein IPP14_00370 [Planctomycetes bacterium]|nr:hypothetical protein [Planctomycetota bacterium]
MTDYNLKDWQAVQRAQRNVAQWLQGVRSEEVRHHMVALAVLAPLALLATLGTAFGIGAMLLAIGGRGLGRSVHGVDGIQALYFGAMGLGLLIVLAGFPYQFVMWRKRQTRVSLHGGGVEVADDRQRPVFLVPTQDANEADWNAGDIICFPATLAGMAAQHVLAMRQLAACDLTLLAKVLTLLAHQGRRMSLYDVEMSVADASLPKALAALRHVPGVLWWTRDQVAVSVNDDLRRQIARQGGWRT